MDIEHAERWVSAHVSANSSLALPARDFMVGAAVPFIMAIIYGHGAGVFFPEDVEEPNRGDFRTV